MSWWWLQIYVLVVVANICPGDGCKHTLQPGLVREGAKIRGVGELEHAELEWWADGRVLQRMLDRTNMPACVNNVMSIYPC
jgi:hypothetical protein